MCENEPRAYLSPSAESRARNRAILLETALRLGLELEPDA